MRNNARALSFAVFLSGSLTAAPALAEEAASVARPGSLAQAATLDAQTKAATDGLWLQLSDGYWEQAIEAASSAKCRGHLLMPLHRAPQTV